MSIPKYTFLFIALTLAPSCTDTNAESEADGPVIQENDAAPVADAEQALVL